MNHNISETILTPDQGVVLDCVHYGTVMSSTLSIVRHSVSRYRERYRDATLRWNKERLLAILIQLRGEWVRDLNPASATFGGMYMPGLVLCHGNQGHGFGEPGARYTLTEKGRALHAERLLAWRDSRHMDDPTKPAWATLLDRPELEDAL